MAEVQERNFFEIERPKPDVTYPMKVKYCGGTNFTLNFTYQLLKGCISLILSLCIHVLYVHVV